MRQSVEPLMCLHGLSRAHYFLHAVPDAMSINAVLSSLSNPRSFHLSKVTSKCQSCCQHPLRQLEQHDVSIWPNVSFWVQLTPLHHHRRVPCGRNNMHTNCCYPKTTSGLSIVRFRSSPCQTHLDACCSSKVSPSRSVVRCKKSLHVALPCS
jgi:hypothetical protein